eukprot:TRINITY_DN58964_c0_g1_i1.p1 TRINITY_DN58964_c0_g1~~TRINITY_DN58964_c0_g1_i1.p1  ORF type:complete len:470 (-),score=86.53 TRINITY_DN58964_c0_g1_i1:72-1481(-)
MADASAGCGQATSSPFEHVVVLMMENQSFDRMLGFVPGVGRLTGEEGFCGRSGNMIRVRKGAHPVRDHEFDPPHSFQAVCSQLYKAGAPTTPDVLPDGSQMLAAVQVMKGGEPSSQQYQEKEADFLTCFADDGTGTAAFATLAKNFTTCDRWFSSFPGPTAPNRLFTHCATSGGYTGGKWRPELGLLVPPTMDSVFEGLDRAGHTWGLYYDGGAQGDLNTAMAIPYVGERRDTHVHDLVDFHEACLTGALPSYSFLSGKLWENSQHPGKKAAAANGMVRGDDLIAEVYEAIRANTDLWLKTLFIVTYDEAGGYWDTVVPRHLVADPGPMPCGSRVQDNSGKHPAFHFRHVGPRVPTLFVSAWHDAGLDSTIYEHASLPKMMKNLFGLKSRAGPDGFLSERDRAANDPLAAHALRATPREDLITLPRSTCRPQQGQTQQRCHRAAAAQSAGVEVRSAEVAASGSCPIPVA